MLKSILLTKVNFKISCPEFYSLLKSSPDVLKQIYSNKKLVFHFVHNYKKDYNKDKLLT